MKTMFGARELAARVSDTKASHAKMKMRMGVFIFKQVSRGDTEESIFSATPRLRVRKFLRSYFFAVISAKNFAASSTSRLGSSAKALLSVSIAITPLHLLFLISAKRPA